jgi:uncharacterized protein (DUF2141 family)
MVASSKSVFLFLIPFILIFLNRCANPVTPQGGPKDIRPPNILECDPPNLSPHFQSRRIKITFDEFVQLKDPRNQITISPPLLPKTEFSLRSKSLFVKINDSLRPNTTYSIIFGEAISDLTENNILRNFNYVVTTGAYIDSLTLRGKIIDAFNLMPRKDVYAMLYINENDTIPFDSLPYLVRPYYLAKTNEKGEFIFHNLRNADYKLFALKDMNGDFLYNLPTEKIAFLDSLAKGIYVSPEIQDSVKTRDTLVKKDTTHAVLPTIPSYSLRLFEQTDSTQKLLRSDLVQEGEVRLIFRFPAKKLVFTPVNFTPEGTWEMEEYSRKKDTIYLWLTNVPADSLILKIEGAGEKADTAIIDLKSKTKKKPEGKKEKVKPDVLKLSQNIPGNKLNQFKGDLEITFSYPVSGYRLSKISLISSKDTLKPRVSFPDSVKRKIRISAKWKEDQSYRLIIPDSTFFSINRLSNDSLVADFKTKSIKDFGTFNVDIRMDQRPGNYIIQLLDEKENVLEEQVTDKPVKIRYDYLSPGNYKLKAILDQNKNGQWDSGIYLKHKQPEEVFYFLKTIEVRGNWDVDETWPL